MPYWTSLEIQKSSVKYTFNCNELELVSLALCVCSFLDIVFLINYCFLVL